MVRGKKFQKLGQAENFYSTCSGFSKKKSAASPPIAL